MFARIRKTIVTAIVASVAIASTGFGAIFLAALIAVISGDVPTETAQKPIQAPIPEKPTPAVTQTPQIEANASEPSELGPDPIKDYPLNAAVADAKIIAKLPTQAERSEKMRSISGDECNAPEQRIDPQRVLLAMAVVSPENIKDWSLEDLDVAANRENAAFREGRSTKAADLIDKAVCNIPVVQEKTSEVSQQQTTNQQQTGYISGTCADLRAKGLSNFPVGDPNYTAKRDRDGDGIACDSR